MKLISFVMGVAAFLTPVVSIADNLLHGPEHATYDIVHDRYLISNWSSGTVVAMDGEGNQSPFISGLGHAYANHIVGDTLYVTVGSGVRAFDLPTGAPLWNQPILGSRQLDGLASDNSGNLYIVDNAIDGRIYKMKIIDRSYEIFVGSDLPEFPQDIIFDEDDDRLLLASFTAMAPLLAVDLSDGSLSTVRTTPFGNCDGIAMDNDGNVYLTCYTAGKIYRYNYDFLGSAVEISSGHIGPAGLGYNPVDDILAVPNYGGDRVDLLGLGDDDGDGLMDFKDNCPDDYNPDQIDSDNDNVGNSCDNCIDQANYNQLDSDDDEVGDACDNCPDEPNPFQDDPDGDDVGSGCDNCPNHYNPLQDDYDGDNIGNICDFICGDFDSDKNINILDIVYLINFLYKSGASPSPLDKMDVNSDGSLNILDIVYLINNIYKGGPEPVCQY